MPAKPTWFGRLELIITELDALPQPWVDRGTLQRLLGVGSRRAQQILAPCVSRQLGANGLAERGRVVEHLRQLAAGEAAHYEQARRERFLRTVETWRQEWLQNRRLPVAAPTSIVNQEFEGLPAGMELGPGYLVVRFADPHEGLEKLLALAMAIGNDFERFADLTCPVKLL